MYPATPEFKQPAELAGPARTAPLGGDLASGENPIKSSVQYHRYRRSITLMNGVAFPLRTQPWLRSVVAATTSDIATDLNMSSAGHLHRENG